MNDVATNALKERDLFLPRWKEAEEMIIRSFFLEEERKRWETKDVTLLFSASAHAIERTSSH